MSEENTVVSEFFVLSLEDSSFLQPDRMQNMKRLLYFSLIRVMDISVLNFETFPYFGRNFIFLVT